jgi:hypothetical protein
VENNRSDLQVALQAVQEEKKIVERELLSLRAQLAHTAQGGNATGVFNSTLHQVAAGGDKQVLGEIKPGDMLSHNNLGSMGMAPRPPQRHGTG